MKALSQTRKRGERGRIFGRRLVWILAGILILLFAAPPTDKLYSQRRRIRRVRRAFVRGATPESPGRLLAKSALILDVPSRRILYEYNADEVRSIASLTKLMTAIVFLEGNPPLDSVVTVIREDAQGAGRHSRMGIGESFKLLDVLYASLLSSDNRATRTLARASGLSMDNFVVRMNEKARELGLDSTSFVEVTGLDPGNHSTAFDLADLLSAALENYWVAHITSTDQYAFQSVNKHRRHILLNTNRLARAGWEVEGGKTGFIAASGYCLTTILKDKEGHEIMTVLLGAPTNSRRFSETIYIIDWLNRYVYPRQSADTTQTQE